MHSLFAQKNSTVHAVRALLAPLAGASCLVSSAGSVTASAASPASARPPNIVLMLADDMGYAGIGCFGGIGAQTPTLDRLAAEGVRCTDFHSNGSVCSPTRAALVTGRYPERVGLAGVFHPGDGKGVSTSNPSLARELKQRGYATGLVGKWHLGEEPQFRPQVHGFDEFFGFLSGNIDSISHLNTQGKLDYWQNDVLKDRPGYATDHYTGEAVDFIKRNKDGPFFLYFAHGAIHVPLQAPGDEPLRTGSGPKKLHPYKGNYDTPGYQRRYRAMVKSIDDSMAAIVRTLRELGLEENTLIIFTSDNGAEPEAVEKAPQANGPWRGAKITLYEGGTRLPAIFYWKNTLKGGRVEKQTMITMDLFPTLLGIASGAKSASAASTALPASSAAKPDGVDLWPAISRGENLPTRDLFWHTWNGNTAIRHGDWKMLRQNGKVELYNLADDPAEQKNRADEPALAPLVKTMIDSNEGWWRDVTVGTPLTAIKLGQNNREGKK